MGKIKIKSGLRTTFLDKFQMLAILLFIGGIFLLDVNANHIGAYGLGIEENFINGIKVRATDMFWLGFIISSLSFFVIILRSMFYHKTYPTKLDIVFGAIGVIGLMIILSGGILLFWHPSSLPIPFFGVEIIRASYYHFGIGLSIISILYFALTK